MKTLSILRHGKTERLEGYPSDRVRPLSSRGVKDAGIMGDLLARFEPAPDWIISSPVLRTQQTTEQIVRVLTYSQPIIWEEAIYQATPMTLLQVLSGIPPAVEHALVVGHNPGLQELVSGLCAGAPDRLGITMATGALACIELEIVWWNQIRWGCGALQLLAKPKIFRE